MTRSRNLTVPPDLSSFPADVLSAAVAEDAKTKEDIARRAQPTADGDGHGDGEIYAGERRPSVRVS